MVVTTSDGDTFDAYVHSLDALADLAIVKLTKLPKQYKCVTFGAIENTRPGVDKIN